MTLPAPPNRFANRRLSVATLIQSLSDSLDMVASVVRVFHSNLHATHIDPFTVFPATKTALQRMIDFSAMGWLTLADGGQEFQLVEIDPEDKRDLMQEEIKHHVQKGTFSWALYHNRPLLVPSKALGKMALLHVLSTRTRVLGMFIGIIDDENISIPAETETLLSILLMISASITENLMLYKELKTHTQNLEQMIHERTRELRHSTESAQTANAAKSNFLAAMSHEIRSPMNGVMGMCELLMETPLNTEQKEYVDSIHSSSKSLLNIINDILDFSRLESGKMNLCEDEFDLRDCLEDAIYLLGNRANDKQLDLWHSIAPNVPFIVRGDADRLQQILINLLDNALKFTQVGHINIKVELSEGDVGHPSTGSQPTASETAAHSENEAEHIADPDGWQPMELHITVEDTGIGIAADKLEKIFDAFAQADYSIMRRYGGSGLGLAITARLVSMLGGKIRVDSELSRGTAFCFSIKVKGKPVQEGIPQSLANPILSGKRVLILEDSRVGLDMLSTLCTQWGMHPQAYNQASQAISVLRETPDWDILLIDSDTPNIHGAELAVEIRKFRSPQEIPLILMGSLGNLGKSPLFRETRSYQLLDEAVCDFVNKPINHRKLQQTLVDVLSGHPRNIQKAPARSVLDPELAAKLPLRLLVVEDNPINQKLAVQLLVKMGYFPDLAQNGQEGFEAASNKTYDIIFMDVQMPDMDGMEATQHIIRRYAGQPEKKPIIIAMTAHALQEDMDHCLQAGMDDYISKPIYIEEVQEKLRAWGMYLQAHRQSLSVSVPGFSAQETTIREVSLREIPLREVPLQETSSIEKAMPSTESGTMNYPINKPMNGEGAESMSVSPPVRLEVLLGRIDNNRKVAQELLGLFLQESEAIIQQLSATSINDIDHEIVIRQTHKLKGMCQDIGAEPLSNLVLQLELWARAEKGNQPHQYDPIELLKELRTSYSVVRDELNAWLKT
jgi:signal transduction histidine kinase/CheY-like chemotaxis protein/HPt (histidine-containing phosphotransfer) domain-containing protein